MVTAVATAAQLSAYLATWDGSSVDVDVGCTRTNSREDFLDLPGGDDFSRSANDAAGRAIPAYR